MSIQLPVKIFVLVSLLTMIAEGPACAQQQIEKYLLEQDLVSASQLKKYKDKEKADDEYVRLMIKFMRGEKGDRKYRREMEKEYKEEIKKKEQNKDTLSILADILEGTTEKRSYLIQPAKSDANDSTNIPASESFLDRDKNDPAQVVILLNYVHQLRTNKLISEGSAGKLSDHIKNDHIHDSSYIVKKAIGLREREIATTKLKLVELMNLLKDINVLSKERYERLINETIPDSVNKVFHIVSNSEKVVFLPRKNFFIKDRTEFDQLIETLSRFAGIEVSDPSIEFFDISKDPRSFRGFVTMGLRHNGKRFFYEGNEMWSSEKKIDTFLLYDQSIYKIFNKILISKNSPYRIHEIRERSPSYYIYEPWSGYILLNRSQSEQLYRNENVDISYEENIDPLSEENILKAIARYKEVGWFSKLPQSYIDSVLEDIKANPVYRYNELVSRFKLISLTINERIPVSREELIAQIRSYAQLSDHAFDFQNIRFVKDSTGKTQVKFEVNNKTYTSDFDMPWMNAWHITHNAVFSDPDRKGQFAMLRIGQHLETYIYLTHKQRNLLEKEKLIGDW